MCVCQLGLHFMVSRSVLNKLPVVGQTALIRQGLHLGGGKLPTSQWLEVMPYQHWNDKNDQEGLL